MATRLNGPTLRDSEIQSLAIHSESRLWFVTGFVLPVCDRSTPSARLRDVDQFLWHGRVRAPRGHRQPAHRYPIDERIAVSEPASCT